jgi:hypothetical protein
VFVAVTVNVFVTVKFEAIRFAKFDTPDATIPPLNVALDLTVNVLVDVSENTFRLPWTLE